jgi:hypothetical protein
LPSCHPEIATDKGADLIVAGARGRILDLLPDRGLNFVFEAAQAARARELVYVDDDEPGTISLREALEERKRLLGCARAVRAHMITLNIATFLSSLGAHF